MREKDFGQEPNDFEVGEKEVADELQKAVWVLGWLDVSNLTNIELSHLKKDIKGALKEKKYLLGLNNLQTIKLNSTFPFEEAIARFLSHYGIEMAQVSFKYDQKVPLSDQIIFDEPGRAYIKQRLKEAREESHKPFLD